MSTEKSGFRVEATKSVLHQSSQSVLIHINFFFFFLLQTNVFNDPLRGEKNKKTTLKKINKIKKLQMLTSVCVVSNYQ